MSNPFQIRTDILAMAKDYMDAQYKLNLETYQKAIELGETFKAELPEVPKMYTVEEMLEQAKKMYSFVETK